MKKSEARGRFFVSAKIGKERAAILLDYGADLSICPLSMRKSGVFNRLKNEFFVKSFDGATHSRIKESVILTLDFGETRLTGEFFIADVEIPILGCDIFREPLKSGGLNTKTDTLTVNDVCLKTAPTPERAMKLLEANLSAQQKQETLSCSRRQEKKSDEYTSVIFLIT